MNEGSNEDHPEHDQEYGPIEMRRDDNRISFSVTVTDCRIKTSCSMPATIEEKLRREVTDLWLSTINQVMAAAGHRSGARSHA